MRLGCIRLSAKRSNSPRKLPRSFLSPAGALRRKRRGRGTQALVTGDDPLWLLHYYHQQQQQDEEAEKGGRAGNQVTGGGGGHNIKFFKALTESPCQRTKAPISTRKIKQNGVVPPTGVCMYAHKHTYMEVWQPSSEGPPQKKAHSAAAATPTMTEEQTARRVQGASKAEAAEAG